MMFAVCLVGLMMFAANSISLADNIGVDNYLRNDVDETVATIPILFRRGKFFEGLIIDTYWCGSGNAANYEGEFGPNYEVDECCYLHDRCKPFILAGETKYGLTNSRPFTSVSCDCDADIYRCLRNVGSDSARAVIYLYSMTNPQCFIRTDKVTRVCASAFPGQPCKSYRGIVDGSSRWENSLFRDQEPPVTEKPTISIENQSIKLTNTDEDKVMMPLPPNYRLHLSNEQYQPQPQHSNHQLSPRYPRYPQPQQYPYNQQPPQYPYNQQIPHNEHQQIPHNEHQPPSHNEHYQPAPQNQLC